MNDHKVMQQRSTAVFAATVLLLALLQSVEAGKGPCDYYKDGGTPCVAAHSMVRALYESYDGPLYQIQRQSDGKTLDIRVLRPGGYANAAAVDSFLQGTSGTVSKIYDQSERKNHLTMSEGGSATQWKPLKESPATRFKDTISGHPVYPLATVSGEGYRNNKTNGVATGDQAEGMYVVCSGKNVNSGCCWDYGNAESDAEAGGKPTGAMEALYFGSNCWFSPCNGQGPWFFADLEWGLFQVSPNGTSNISLPHEYAAGFLKGDKATITMRANDATQDVLKLLGSGNRPSGWVTNILTGAIILGIGGDSAPSGKGTFFEGAMTIGRPTDAAEDSVQKNISRVYSHRDTVPTVGVRNSVVAAVAPSAGARYNPSTGTAVITGMLQEAGRVKITILDQCGRTVASIANGVQPAGMQKTVWKCGQIPAGVYLWRIAADGRGVGTGKIVVSK